MFEFQSCECGKTHRMLACVNVARFTVKGDQGDESIAGTTYCSSTLCFLPKSSCLGWGQKGMPKSKKNMLDSRWNAESKLYRRHICSRMLAGTRVQWCAGKYLTNESPGNKNFCFVMGANFHSIKYAYRGQFQATNLTSLHADLGRNVKLVPGHQSVTLRSSIPSCST